MKFRFVLAAVLSFSVLSAPPLQAAPSAAKAPDVNAPSDLLRAAAAGDVTLLRSALKRGAPLEIRDSQYLFTPLGWAAWRGQSKAVSALLAAGANTEARSVGGAPMPVTVKIPLLGNMTGPEPSDQTPLGLAILGKTPQTTAIVRDLLRHGAKPNTQTGSGNNALVYATLFNQMAVVDALLARGADPNQRGSFFSPLAGSVVCIDGENLPLVRKLLAAGANPNDRMFNNTVAGFARAVKRTRSANLIEAAQKTKLQEQIRTAAKPAILYPEANSIPTILE